MEFSCRALNVVPLHLNFEVEKLGVSAGNEDGLSLYTFNIRSLKNRRYFVYLD